MALEVRTVVQLSTREETFIMALARGKKPCAAALAAGYSICSPRHLLAKPHLAAALRSICSNVNAAVARCDKLALAGD
jgi:phage terminase small subunit